jgi:hypothetical protein
VANWEADRDPPCDELTENPSGEWGHHCKYGLVELHPANQEAVNAWRFLQIFGPEAGTRMLIAHIGEAAVSEMAESLMLLQAVKNRHDNREK